MKKEKRMDIDIRKECKKNKVWELFYPDGTSSLMSYDPIENVKENIIKEVEKWWSKITTERKGFKDKFFTLDYEDIKDLKTKIKGLK